MRARERIHDTRGSVGSRGAECEVRPETRVLGPWEREMKEGSKSGELVRGRVSIDLCAEGKKGVRVGRRWEDTVDEPD